MFSFILSHWQKISRICHQLQNFVTHLIFPKETIRWTFFENHVLKFYCSLFFLKNWKILNTLDGHCSPVKQWKLWEIDTKYIILTAHDSDLLKRNNITRNLYFQRGKRRICWHTKFKSGIALHYGTWSYCSCIIFITLQGEQQPSRCINFWTF